MLLYRVGWERQPVFHLPENQTQTRISVVIPARNETENIEACLRSILTQNYPESLFEIILVDDHSDDDTVLKAEKLGSRIRVLHLKDQLNGRPGPGFKKMALAMGIEASRGELIVSTDADCVAGKDWLRNLAVFFERHDASMIIAPVAYFPEGSLSARFQLLDFMTMQGITAASQRLGLGGMANGANLAFSREAFDKVEGYKGIDHLASGDDYLLLGKMRKQFPDRVFYLKSKDAIVQTSAQPGWKAFLRQRVRWASKTGRYPDPKLTSILALVYLFNVSLLVVAVAAIWNRPLWLFLAGILFIKIISELLLLLPVARFFRLGKSLWIFPFLQPLHVMYIVAAGFLGFFGKYEWKGRRLH